MVEPAFEQRVGTLLDMLPTKAAGDATSECFFERSHHAELELSAKPRERLLQRRAESQREWIEEGISIRPLSPLRAPARVLHGFPEADITDSLASCAIGEGGVEWDLPSSYLSLPSTTEAHLALQETLDYLLEHTQLRGASATLRLWQRQTLVVTPEGRCVASVVPAARLKLEVSMQGIGGVATSVVTSDIRAHKAGFNSFELQRAAHEALDTLRIRSAAVHPPEGDFPVIMSGGRNGTWLHEVAGHPLEADMIEHGPFAGMVGSTVAPEFVSVVDPPRATRFDDEGSQAIVTPLIEEGVLVGSMRDRIHGDAFGRTSTGNGRRANYRHPPIPRMWGVSMQPGMATVKDLCAGVARGILLNRVRSAQVLPSGAFVLNDAEGHLIENGEIGRPVAGFRVAGDARQSLMDIEAVGRSVDVASTADCLKAGQKVPVNISMPPVRFRTLQILG